ncbi:histidinol-phosphatase HisJ family protein [Hespellia stercorisuis]|uniref:Histidinol-phosphatase n=1 Tax=Hespellia stercorisuis DSM 15480 TaxID=1121950 RepID=A0A1M6UST7_9FIRM|nr:histidinol-phosphatase HisJ family protein [Hespellia stercorisuis]SHK72262.1 histidinol-phosphatase (PHP family) [Hespellia stercorisuis DSM 15480]
MYADYHLHTYYSDDSDYPMEQLVLDAISKGLQEICLTDHVDYGVKDDWTGSSDIYHPEERAALPVMNVNYPAYHAQIQMLQKKYAEKIVIREGMEFGMQVHTIPEYRKLFSSYPFDFIILSCHQVEDKEFWNQDFQNGKTQEEYNRTYYEEILQVIRRYKDYSVLGHLDMITRYDQAGIYPFEKVADLVIEILKQVIADGKGIEVNTSCHRYGLSDLTPSREILRLYRELGGTIVTIGSDTHEPSHLAAYIRETMDELKTLGFTSLCTYQNMVPAFHAL